MRIIHRCCELFAGVSLSVSFQSADPELSNVSSRPSDVSLMWWWDAALASLTAVFAWCHVPSSTLHYIWLRSGPLALTVSHITCNVNLSVHISICLHHKGPVLHLWLSDKPSLKRVPGAMTATVWSNDHRFSLSSDLGQELAVLYLHMFEIFCQWERNSRKFHDNQIL